MKRIFLLSYLFALSLSVVAQNTALLPPDSTFMSYVLNNGHKVEACYVVRWEDGEAMLGSNSYNRPAIDTTLVGRIEIPDHVTAPDGRDLLVTGVSRQSFANCTKLTEVVMPELTRDIGDQSFMNCRSLTRIVLPPTVKKVWPFAFRGCSRLNTVVVKALTPPDVYNDAFDLQAYEYVTLVVPASSEAAYKRSFVWNMFRYCFANIDE